MLSLLISIYFLSPYFCLPYFCYPYFLVPYFFIFPQIVSEPFFVTATSREERKSDHHQEGWVKSDQGGYGSGRRSNGPLKALRQSDAVGVSEGIFSLSSSDQGGISSATEGHAGQVSKTAKNGDNYSDPSLEGTLFGKERVTF
jgi:hypothetical protein